MDAANACLVTGSVVVANNYFKAFLSSWVNLFGGEMRSYQRLIEQGRRLAVVRMLENANQFGADKVWNIRLQTSTTQSGLNKKMAGIELIAYGTAIVDK
ncbi:MAG: YbjQ family protein [Lentisphaerae bacterium]|nr:YbjQ family protein [Lentisphaerota bacterium]MCP4103255.1 YbjQ family protein [Lentisphaerota bacterium]